MDLLAKVRFRESEASFLIHIENQAIAQDAFARRMFRYFARLHEKHELPIYPIAVLLYDTPARPEPDRYEVRFPDRKVLEFSYRAIQLNRLNWRDFLRKPNAVAAALMTKMRIASEDRPRVKLECLRMIVTLRLDPGYMDLIQKFMVKYMKLSEAEQLRYNLELQSINPTQREAVMNMKDLTDRPAIERTVLRQLERRFGPLPYGLADRVTALEVPGLEQLADALLDFKQLSDAIAWLDAHPELASSE